MIRHGSIKAVFADVAKDTSMANTVIWIHLDLLKLIVII